MVNLERETPRTFKKVFECYRMTGDPPVSRKRDDSLGHFLGGEESLRRF